MATKRLNRRRKGRVTKELFPKQSNDLSLYELMTQKAKPRESMSNYATRLRKFADKCDFRDWSGNKMIKCLVFTSMKNEELRRSLMEMDLRLDEVLDKVTEKEDTAMMNRSKEATRDHIEVISPVISTLLGHTSMSINPRENQEVLGNQDCAKKPDSVRTDEGSDYGDEFVEDDFTEADDFIEPRQTQADQESKKKGSVRTKTDDNDKKDVNHQTRKHSEQVSHKCLNCGQEFQDDASLQTHMVDHRGQKHSDCPTCVKGFPLTEVLKNHLAPHVEAATMSQSKEASRGHGKIPFPVISGLLGHTSVGSDPREKNKNKQLQAKQKCKKKPGPVKTETHDKDMNAQKRKRSVLVKVPKKCFYCLQEFQDDASLQAHMVNHTGQTYSVCATCVNGFTQSGDLSNHLAAHVAAEWHLISSAVSNRDRVTGIDLTHEDASGDGHRCSDCGEICNSPAALKRHMRMHSDGRTYTCSICDKVFRKVFSLKQHMLTHTFLKPHQCHICGKGYKQEGTLKRHMMIHTDERPHKCPICSKRFREAAKVKVHMMVHTGEKPHQCYICGKRFSEKSSLNSHMTIHSDQKPDKLHQCSECGKTFKTLGSLKVHMMIHSGEKPHKCPTCDKCFKEAAKLKIHMMIHTGEKPHKCPMCDKHFSVKSKLNGHMLTHTGEKRLECDVCKKRFAIKLGLDLHMRTHTGVKPYKCSICSKQFTQQSSLKLHTRTHTGEKPYQCSKCGLKLTQISSLKRHEMTHTDKKK